MTCGCGCSGGTGAGGGAAVGNAPGLPEIAYRAGRRAGFLAEMVDSLAGDRPLRALGTRQPDDLTLSLLDAWATACDVVCFYTERLAGESYLGTAQELVSLQELGALVGYRLRAGSAAQTPVAFALARPAALPAGRPGDAAADPGATPPANPDLVVLPAGLRIQSVPGPGETPQTFETVEDLEARSAWNSLPVVTSRPWPPVTGHGDVWFAGGALVVARGDVVLFAPDVPPAELRGDRWDVRLVERVERDRPGDRTRVVFDRPLGSIDPYNPAADHPDSFLLRKRIPVFGHAAPMWRSMPASFRGDYAGQAAAGGGDWPGFTALGGTDAAPTVDLEGSHPEVVAGSWVVVSQEGEGYYRELYRVTARAELSRSEFGVSGTVTRLTLAGEAHGFGTPRQVTVLAVPDPVTVVDAPDLTDVTTAAIEVVGDATAMAPGRSLALVGSTADGDPFAEVVTLTFAVADGVTGNTWLNLTRPPSVPLRREGLAVFGNLALATHGETVGQVLGSADARTPGQEFPLQYAPLTYVQADSVSGVESTLTVRVDDIAWTEVPTLYGHGSSERVFETRAGTDGAVRVRFGDGERGARPGTGRQNVRATYRRGIGAAGNVAAGRLSVPLDRPLGLQSVVNPVAATGGVDPEAADHARASIPLPVRTLGRVVSLADYADLARAYTGIVAADATVVTLQGASTIVVTVVGVDAAPVPADRVRNLTATLRSVGDPHVHVLVVPAPVVTFRVAMRLVVDPAREPGPVGQAVAAALHAAYDPLSRRLGQAVFASAVIATAAAVPGVVSCDLQALYRSGTPVGSASRVVAVGTRVGPGGVVLPVELLGLAADGVTLSGAGL